MKREKIPTYCTRRALGNVLALPGEIKVSPQLQSFHERCCKCCKRGKNGHPDCTLGMVPSLLHRHFMLLGLTDMGIGHQLQLPLKTSNKTTSLCPLCPLGMLWYWTGYVTECVQWAKAKSLFQNTALPLSLLHSPKPTGKRRELQYKCNVVIQITLIPALRGVKLQKRLLHSLMEEFCISYGPTVVAWEPAGSSAKYG